ncbi:MAG: ABC transporter permease [Phycisphaerales bacterium]
MMIFRVLSQTVILALAQLKYNWMRALLTTLGIVIGVWAVIFTVAMAEGMRNYVLDQFESIGASRVWIFPRRPRESGDRFSWRQIRISNKEAFGMMAACPSLKRITPIKGFSQDVQFGDRKEPNVNVQGIWPEWHDIEDRTVMQGRPFMRIDDEDRRQVCIVNDKAIEELALPAEPVGKPLLVGGRKFLIVGVVETKSVGAMFGGGESRTEVYIPFGTADLMRPEWMSGIYIAGQTHTPEQFEDVRAEVRFFMRNSRQLKPDDPDTFGVEAIEQHKEQFKSVSKYMTIGATVLGGISLFVGGVGIMNIMFVSVSERTREIGLRKAMGAQPPIVLAQFLVEAIVLCLVGALIGMAIAVGLVAMVRSGGGESPLTKAAIPLWSVVVSMGFAAMTGLVFGMFPAIKAARMDPIVALRHE